MPKSLALRLLYKIGIAPHNLVTVKLASYEEIWISAPFLSEICVTESISSENYVSVRAVFYWNLSERTVLSKNIFKRYKKKRKQYGIGENGEIELVLILLLKIKVVHHNLVKIKLWRFFFAAKWLNAPCVSENCVISSNSSKNYVSASVFTDTEVRALIWAKNIFNANNQN